MVGEEAGRAASLCIGRRPVLAAALVCLSAARMLGWIYKHARLVTGWPSWPAPRLPDIYRGIRHLVQSQSCPACRTVRSRDVGAAGSGDVSGEALALPGASADPLEFCPGVRRLLAVFHEA